MAGRVVNLPAPRPDREDVTGLALLIEESEVCGLRVVSAAELRKAGTRLLSCLTISPTQLRAQTGHWLALARVAGTVIVIIDVKSPLKSAVYLHNGDVDPLDIKAIEQAVRAGAYPKPAEEDE